MFFAWAIGGEPHFGKWRRGILIAIPMSILFISKGLYIWLFPLWGVLYGVYQALFYDLGISMYYDQRKWLGMPILAFNGLLIAIPNCVYYIVLGSWPRSIWASIVCALWFVFIVTLSNKKLFRPYREWLNKYMPSLPYLRFKDSWYVSEGLMGLMLGLLL